MVVVNRLDYHLEVDNLRRNFPTTWFRILLL